MNFIISFERHHFFANIHIFALNVLHVFDSNSKGKAHIKKSLTLKPSSLLVVIGRHKDSMVGKAV